MRDLGRLIVRLVVGGLLAGHGAQKLFGWFEGPGPEGTRGMMANLDLHPPHRWAFLAGLSEFGGGMLMALGALNPLGPIGVIGAMSMATAKVHAGKPIWATEGGAELPVTNMASALAIAIVGPGKYSIDHMLGIGMPRWIGIVGLLGVLVVVGRATQPMPAEPKQAAEGATTGPQPSEEPEPELATA